MVGWIILAVLVGIITLIMVIPIGADIRYEDGVIRISAKFAGKAIQLIPKKKKAPKPEKKPKEENFLMQRVDCISDLIQALLR